MRLIAFCVMLMAHWNGLGQSVLTGKVTDQQRNALPGASIYILNTLDGTSSNAEGIYTLTTTEKGEHILVVSMIGYETMQQSVRLEDKANTFNFVMKEAVSELDEVVISAGTIEATNDRKVAVLRPLDIVTTAGAAGDIIGAIQTLPGTTRVGEQTGLFVRGGDASEAAVVIDGMVVQNFFTSDVPGVAQRSRFSPFQFKGTAFSSGGYSARYGQALSSILELNSNDMPSKGTFNAGVSMAGLFASAAKVFKNNSLEVTGSYTNVAPFYAFAKTNFDFYKAPEGGSGSVRWVAQNGDKRIFKMLVSGGAYTSGTQIPDMANAGARYRFGLQNKNVYMNSSYSVQIHPRLHSYTAASFSKNEDRNNLGASNSNTNEWRLQARSEIDYDISDQANLVVGTEWQRFTLQRSFDSFRSDFYETQGAFYAEMEWKPLRKFGMKTGVRAENSFLLDRKSVSPRLSAALKTGKHSQVSLASGIFYQTPNNRYLVAAKLPDQQQSVHYIANYKWITDQQTFRIEGYYKSYNQLVRELGVPYNPNAYRFVNTPIDNSGNGYAQGIDVFWRDRALIKNLDYWISYSWVDTQRLFENFPSKATPSFISNHNINVIAKYFIESLKLNISATYSYATGRPYYNPNNLQFLQDRALDYENVSMNITYVTSIKKVFAVFYVGVDNLLDRHNVFGYRYSSDGLARYPIEPPIYRSFFVGINFSLSAFNRDEL
ncbi:MAG: TonB-dependent receptor [Flammeovirgaceae bacterium]|nr:TonB-dependent receptor [Flammeovirgaceae bacterium]